MYLIILLLINFILVLLMMVLIQRGFIYADYGMWAVMTFLPFLGEIIVLLFHIHTKLRLNGRKADDIERGRDVKENNETGFFQDDDRDNMIPLEDALILNNGRERQKVLRDAILSGTSNRKAVLLKASKNSDSEIVHFATTAMAHAEGEFEKEVSRLEVDVRKAKNENDMLIALDEEIKVLSQFIKNTEEDSGIVLERQEKLIDLLKTRTKLHPTIEYMNMLSEIYLDTGDTDSAYSNIKRTAIMFPKDPDTWILQFRCYFMLHKKNEMDKMMENYRKDLKFKNARIEKIVSFWEETEAR